MWGGEVLQVDFESYKRVGHLKHIRLLGGDKATEDPRRLVYAIFSRFDEHPFFTEEEATVFDRMLPSAPLSSSMGRILDALACYLDICCKRTYDGETAMKLERYLSKGTPMYPFDVTVSDGTIDTIDLFRQLHDYRLFPIDEKKKADIATSFVDVLIQGMCQIAIDTAENEQIKHIGLTGGVSYNIPITEMVAKQVKDAGYNLLVHQRIPNGDGGIAVGQNVLGAHLLK
jgi:hydrogenase maturation protein HypF